MSVLKWIFGVANVAAWFSWDLTGICVRTFVLCHSVERQLLEIQPEEGEE